MIGDARGELVRRRARGSVCAEVVAELRPRVVAWLRTQTRAFPPNPIVVGTVEVVGADGLTRDVSYGPDGRLLGQSHPRPPR